MTEEELSKATKIHAAIKEQQICIEDWTNSKSIKGSHLFHLVSDETFEAVRERIITDLEFGLERLQQEFASIGNGCTVEEKAAENAANSG